MMRMPGAKIRSPIFSRRKLVLRATEDPLAALARCPISEPATRGSKITGTLRVGTLRGLTRLTVRSPATVPTCCGESRSAACVLEENS